MTAVGTSEIRDLLAEHGVEVEYTDEALRSMRRAEQTVIAETKRELDHHF